jgi:hypothetical protein
VHQVDCRDNARNGIFTSRTGGSFRGGSRIQWHEFHHAAYGLKDEYCCDGGYGYYPPLANLFDSAERCDRKGAEPHLRVVH